MPSTNQPDALYQGAETHAGTRAGSVRVASSFCILRIKLQDTASLPAHCFPQATELTRYFENSKTGTNIGIDCNNERNNATEIAPMHAAMPLRSPYSLTGEVA